MDTLVSIRVFCTVAELKSFTAAAERRGISSASWPLFGLLWPSGSKLAARLALRVVQPAERAVLRARLAMTGS